MPRQIQFGLIAFAVLMLAGISSYFNLQKRIRELIRPQQEAIHPYLTENPVFSPTDPVRKVRLFFPSVEKDGLLEVEEREIHTSVNTSIEAKEILAELIKGSRAGRGLVLPPQAKLREVFITSSGQAYVDLTKESAEAHPGGLTQEVSTIYSIVNSLTENLPSIQRVQILLEGAEADTLAGHVDLSQPFVRDLSMTSMVESDLQMSRPN
jgi:hypothetical protein